MQVSQILWITIFWVLLMGFEVLIELAIIDFLQFDYRAEDILSGLILNLISAVIAGIVGGSFLVFAWNGWLRTLSYGRSLIAIFLSYTAIFAFIFTTTSLFSDAFNMYEELYPSDDALIQSLPALVTYLKWLVISLATLILLQVNDKYGHGILKDFILGRYFQPKQEERIFLFFDLKSSTTIAEKLGESMYFKFLRDSFRVITPAMIEHYGEVYQYVGDEIVISWKVDKKFDPGKCISCFFKMQQALDDSKHFEKTYGLKPVFKAGLHGGMVMAGEMGIIKREIAYSGDVLNTTSRIRSKCNEYNAHLLVSAYIEDGFEPSNLAAKITPIGNIELRGREKSLDLFKVELA